MDRAEGEIRPARASRRRFGRFTIDYDDRELFVDGEPAGLTRVEFDIVDLLSSAPREAYRPDQIVELIWDERWFDDVPTVSAHIGRLRRKLGSAADECLSASIEQGYRWRAPESDVHTPQSLWDEGVWSAALGHSGAVLLRVDREITLLSASPAGTSVMGRMPSAYLGHYFPFDDHPLVLEDPAPIRARAALELRRGVREYRQMSYWRESGSVRLTEFQTRIIADAAGGFAGLEAIARDLPRSLSDPPD
ncbi:MAG: hypothetical protein RLZ55_1567 [Actinomycetota bacterium]